MCSYGATGSGKLVDAAGLQLLENMGFQRALAAEALKQVTVLSLSLQNYITYFVDLSKKKYLKLYYFLTWLIKETYVHYIILPLCVGLQLDSVRFG